jgi:hypothetical protein
MYPQAQKRAVRTRVGGKKKELTGWFILVSYQGPLAIADNLLEVSSGFEIGLFCTLSTLNLGVEAMGMLTAPSVIVEMRSGFLRLPVRVFAKSNGSRTFSCNIVPSGVEPMNCTEDIIWST